MKFELNDNYTNDVRNLVKSLYEAYGAYEGCKEMGNNTVSVDQVLDVYQSYIQFVEMVLDETNDGFHKKHRQNDTVKKSELANFIRNYRENSR
jgi:hypothetical protein